MNLGLFAKYSDLAPGLEYSSSCLLLQAFPCLLLIGKDLTFSRQRGRDRVRAEFFHVGAPGTVFLRLGAGLAACSLAPQQQMTSTGKQIQKEDPANFTKKCSAFHTGSFLCYNLLCAQR